MHGIEDLEGATMQLLPGIVLKNAEGLLKKPNATQPLGHVCIFSFIVQM